MTNFTKRIVCLAKSRKIGGHCIAGKEILTDSSVGQWIRPVSSRDGEEISDAECQLECGTMFDLLDVLEIELVKHNPRLFQCENYLIDDSYYWSKVGKFSIGELTDICDYPQDLWSPHDSSFYGLKDRVKEVDIHRLEDSLYLISPQELSIQVEMEGGIYGPPKKKVRAYFKYNDINFIFPITDRTVEGSYISKKEGLYSIQNPEDRIFMCISIGLPYDYDNCCYKFVASIIGL